MNFDEAAQIIEQSSVRGSILGLTRIRRLCEILGNPQDHLKFIHVAGTNGKGSTAGYIAAILKAAGYRTGMYYSPALCGIKDHYCIDGDIISDEDYSYCVEKLVTANEKLAELIGEEATQFELETALAFLYFEKNNCDVVILETGMGGQTDATNVISDKLLCVFTSISYDHMHILGKTLEQIATVKAGIITTACPVVAFDSGKEVVDVIRNRCDEVGAGLNIVSSRELTDRFMSEEENTFSYDGYSDIHISLRGMFQQENAALAIKAAKVLGDNGFVISENDIRNGLMQVKWPYRFEKILHRPEVYIDGAHNENAAVRLSETVRQLLGAKDIIMIVGMFKDKEYEKVLAEMIPLAKSVYTLTVPNRDRALDSDIICEHAKKYCDDVTACTCVEEAWKMAKADADCHEGRVILAFGSLSYLHLLREAVLGHEA